MNDWNVHGIPKGEMIQERNVTLYLVHDASHMASYDAPKAARDILKRTLGPPEPFIEAKPILDRTKSPSHMAAALFVVVFLMSVLFGGVYVRKRLRRLTQQPRWNAIPNDDIELSRRSVSPSDIEPMQREHLN
jgi:hypothetical protein